MHAACSAGFKSMCLLYFFSSAALRNQRLALRLVARLPIRGRAGHAAVVGAQAARALIQRGAVLSLLALTLKAGAVGLGSPNFKKSAA